jgi:hypothetical protein
LRRRLLRRWAQAMASSDIDDVIVPWSHGKRP